MNQKGENMSYLINEIYELYEKHLEITEPVLNEMGVEDNIHNYLIDVNIDLEILLESNDLIRYDHDELREKIKSALRKDYGERYAGKNLSGYNETFSTTMSDSNIDNSVLFIGKDGKIMAQCIEYVQAGGGMSSQIIEIE